jgi:3-hydroxyisobutyrate dehydrogenase-like beta-hydroxyacid dehydrogenase
MSPLPSIGFVGLGAMGAPMAARLVGAGFVVTVWNRSPERAAPLVAAGARLAASPAEAAGDADVVISVLFDDAAVEAVAFGEAGLAASMRPGTTHLSCSTISPTLADRLEEEHGRRGQHAVSAPLLGSAAMAAAGTLYLAASGPAEAIERLGPVFSALAQKTLVVGDRARHAVVAKLANNFLLFAVTEAIGEALALAEKSGLPRAAMMDLMWETDFGKRLHHRRRGSAGCVLANRLSADPENRVLVLEAGGKDDWIWFHIPVGYLFSIGNPRADWMFETQAIPGLNGRKPGLSARQGDRRVLGDQRHDLHARPGGRL